jgi:hypothetical protein
MKLQTRCAWQEVTHGPGKVRSVLDLQEHGVGVITRAFHKFQRLEIVVVANPAGELVDPDRVHIGIPFDGHKRRGIDFVLVAPTVLANHKAGSCGRYLTVGWQQTSCQRNHLVTADHIAGSHRNNTQSRRRNGGGVS